MRRTRVTVKQVKSLEGTIESLIKARDLECEQKVLALNLKGVVDEANINLIGRVKSLEGQNAELRNLMKMCDAEADSATGRAQGLAEALTIITRKQ